MNHSITVYGIKNCDTVKKALKFLAGHSISYQFIDYRERPISEKQYENFKDAVGIEELVNRRSTTFRSLSEKEKQSIDFELISKYPTPENQWGNSNLKSSEFHSKEIHSTIGPY